MVGEGRAVRVRHVGSGCYLEGNGEVLRLSNVLPQRRGSRGEFQVFGKDILELGGASSGHIGVKKGEDRVYLFAEKKCDCVLIRKDSGDYNNLFLIMLRPSRLCLYANGMDVKLRLYEQIIEDDVDKLYLFEISNFDSFDDNSVGYSEDEGLFSHFPFILQKPELADKNWCLDESVKGLRFEGYEPNISCVWSRLSLSVKENIVLENILYVLLGVNTELINIEKTTEFSQYEIKLNRILGRSDEATGQLVVGILKQLPCILSVTDFIEKSRYSGLIKGLRRVLQEFVVKVALFETSLKSNKLTLQRLLALSQPFTSTFMMLNRVVSKLKQIVISNKNKISNSTSTIFSPGGSYYYYSDSDSVNVIQDEILAIPPGQGLRALLDTLQEDALDPILHACRRWMQTGYLNPDYVFFVQKKDDKYVNKFCNKYVLVKELIPQLLAPVADKIFKTGLFNLLIEEPFVFNQVSCVVDEKNSNNNDNSRKFHNEVDIFYNAANKQLVNKLMDSDKFFHVIYTMKNIMFMNKGSYFANFLFDVSARIDRTAKDLIMMSEDPEAIITCLQIHLSQCVESCYSDCFSVSLASNSILNNFQHLFGVGVNVLSPVNNNRSEEEIFKRLNMTIDFDKNNRINDIIDEQAILKYQTIFRLLCQLKFIYHQLIDVWADKKNMKGCITYLLREKTNEAYETLNIINSSCLLRDRMMLFLARLIYSITQNAIEPAFQKLTSKLAAATDYSSIKTAHDEYLNKILTDSMIYNKNFLTSALKTISICHLYARHILKFSYSDPLSSPIANHLIVNNFNTIIKQNQDPLYQQMIKSIHKRFDVYLAKLLFILDSTNTPFAVHLHMQLNFNNFFSQRLSVHPDPLP